MPEPTLPKRIEAALKWLSTVNGSLDADHTHIAEAEDCLRAAITTALQAERERVVSEAIAAAQECITHDAVMASIRALAAQEKQP